MDEQTATHIREFVAKGGTVLMTGYSALADEHNRVFSSTLPGRLSDVFGIRVSGFEEPVFLNELSRMGLKGNEVRIAYREREVSIESPRFDVIHPKGAEILGRIVSLDQDYPIVTSNRFGAGVAIYVGVPAREDLLKVITDELIDRLSINTGPAAPAGVMARSIDPRHNLYLNLDGVAKRVDLKGRSRSILRDRDYADGFALGPYEPEFVETSP
jgi:beta-galactosidase